MRVRLDAEVEAAESIGTFRARVDIIGRLSDQAASFVRRFAHSGKLVAAVCHGPQLLIEADAVAGRMLTSWPSVETDLENASVIWIDREVVEDGNLITSRKPDDLDAFCTAILRRIEAKREATGS